MKTSFSRNVERQARRMVDMIERLDVDTFKLAYLREGDSYEEARMTCFDCSNTTQCLRWLDASASNVEDRSIYDFPFATRRWLNASAPNVEPPTFCPNLSLFEFCKREGSAACKASSP